MLQFRPLTANEIDCRVSTCNEKGVSLLLYKDARCDQNILDETVGPMGRLPGAGDDETTKDDAAIVESRYEKWLKRVFDGERK